MPTQEQIIEVIKTIEDPDIFLDIWFLGLIYNIDIQPQIVDILMTFTTPLCPSGPWLIEQVKTKIEALEGVEQVNVSITFNPPWQASDELKELLGIG